MSKPCFIPPELRELAVALKLEHCLAQTILQPTHNRQTAQAEGYRVLSKRYNLRYYEHARSMMELRAEVQKDFDVIVVREKCGVSLWKRSKLRF